MQRKELKEKELVNKEAEVDELKPEIKGFVVSFESCRCIAQAKSFVVQQ